MNDLWLWSLPRGIGDKALDFCFWSAKVDQQTYLQTCRAQIVQSLSHMVVVQHGYRLEFHQHPFFHQQISKEFADHDTIEVDFDRILLRHLHS